MSYSIYFSALGSGKNKRQAARPAFLSILPELSPILFQI